MDVFPRVEFSNVFLAYDGQDAFVSIVHELREKIGLVRKG